MALGFGTLLYVALLLVNAMAVLSEDRFLARIGWVSTQSQAVNAGFSQTYDPNVYGGGQGQGQGQGQVGVKAGMINLLGAVRTVMRIPLIGLNIVVIIYELILG